jgi:hypothetical protein
LEKALINSIEEWRWFIKYSAPGCRFRDRYRRRQQAGRNRSMLRRGCYVAFGVAGLLDRGETKLREALQRTKGVWDKSASGVRALIVLTIILCVVAPVYGALRLFSLT